MSKFNQSIVKSIQKGLERRNKQGRDRQQTKGNLKGKEKGSKLNGDRPFVVHTELNTERLPRDNRFLGTIISLNKEEDDDEYKPARNSKNNQLKNLKLQGSNPRISRMKS